MLTIKTLLNW